MGTTKQTRKDAKAIRERWPMSSVGRAKLIRRLESIAGVGPKPKTGDVLTLDELIGRPKIREAISAIKALMTADRQNLEREQFAHQTKAVEPIDDDYVLDLSDADPEPESDPA